MKLLNFLFRDDSMRYRECTAPETLPGVKKKSALRLTLSMILKRQKSG